MTTGRVVAAPGGVGGDGASETRGSADRRSTRRLTLSPIGFDIILSLSQAPGGLRLVDLGHAGGSPMSSVQTALRILLANGVVERLPGDPPKYSLSDAHPARAELASLATVLPDPERAIGVILRSNPAVTYAGVDSSGFILAFNDSAPEAEDLDRHLNLVGGSRIETPSVLRMTTDEFRRMLRVSPGLRARVESAVGFKGGGLVAMAGRGTRQRATNA